MARSTNDDKTNVFVPNKKKYQRPHLYEANIRKRLRQMGQPYIDVYGRPKDGRSIGESCPSTCHYECPLNFDNVERVRIHQQFWSLTKAEKDEYYLKYIVKVDPKCTSVRSRKGEPKRESRRSNTFLYYFQLNDKRLQVCQRFFLKTLGISGKMVYRVLKKRPDTDL